jgi:hypothetical protein
MTEPREGKNDFSPNRKGKCVFPEKISGVQFKICADSYEE